MIQPFKPYLTNSYPTSDGRPMAETDTHRSIMFELIDVLEHRYSDAKDVYVSGNLLLFYEEGNKRRHVSPDVFVVKGVPKKVRPNYLMWEEGKGPDVVLEITSKTTRAEDIKKKYQLYESRMGVREYFLFDPLEDYLDPSMRGYRRHAGVFRPIRVVEGRLPSQVLGLHLERSGSRLRLWNPATGEWEPNAQDRVEAEYARAQEANVRAQEAIVRASEADARALEAHARVDAERARAERAENEKARLERELEALRRRAGE